jgi:hypothetical protein
MLFVSSSIETLGGLGGSCQSIKNISSIIWLDFSIEALLEGCFSTYEGHWWPIFGEVLPG